VLVLLCAGMTVLVMGIRHMGMGVAPCRVHMRVAVRALGHLGMLMVVVTVAMCVRMLVLQGFMRMLMLVAFQQMQHHTSQQQCGTCCHHP
jgi:hypothetical protein